MSAWSSNTKFENGQLVVAGMAATQLAREFGTPSFILDEADRSEEHTSELQSH